MNKATLAKIAGWGQLLITAVATAIQAQGVPSTAQQWGQILVSALIALSVHHASNTDGSK